MAHDQGPSDLAAYLAKYEATITGVLGMTLDQFDRTYGTRVRIDRPPSG